MTADAGGREWQEERCRSFERQIQSAEARGAIGEVQRLRAEYEVLLEHQRAWQDLEAAISVEEMPEWEVLDYEAVERWQVERLVRALSFAHTASPEQWRLLGLVRLRLGQPDTAIESLDRAVALAPESADAHYLRALALARTGRVGDGLQAIERALDRDRAMAVAHHARGCLLIEAGRAGDAAVSFARAVDLDPTRAHSQFRRGLAFEDTGRITDALAAYRKAVRMDPTLTEAHYRRGFLLRKQGRIDEALDSYERALAGRHVSARASLQEGTHAEISPPSRMGTVPTATTGGLGGWGPPSREQREGGHPGIG